MLQNSIGKDVYDDDLTDVYSALIILEDILFYQYQEETTRLELIRDFIVEHHPNDPIIHDIDAMMRRNETIHAMYSKKFENAVNRRSFIKRDTSLKKIHHGENEQSDDEE